VADEPQPSSSGRARLAGALRHLIDLNVSARVDDLTFIAAAESVEAVTASLEAARQPGRASRPQPKFDGSREGYFPTSPIVGGLSPVAPPVSISVAETEDGAREIRGTAWFGYAYEGPSTFVHGGVLAELFDELLGAAGIAAGRPGLTGTLTIKFRRPTPLRADLRVEARFIAQEGRKIHSWAGVYHADVLTAEADGVFIEVGPEQYLSLAAANADSSGSRLADVIGIDAKSVSKKTAERIGFDRDGD